MTEPHDETAASHARYRTAFSSPSLGTEEELIGPRVKMKTAAAQVIGIVRRNEVLVEVTKDVQKSGDKISGDFTIELRTTPCELTAEADWEDRTKALNVAIVSLSGRNWAPLTNDVYRGYETVIFNKDHQISCPNDVTRSDRQATVGVPAAEIGESARSDDLLGSGKLHEQVALPWYEEEFARDLEVKGLAPREQVGYALVMSAISKLASIWHQRMKLNADSRKGTKLFENSVEAVDVKNQWLVRPRTAPICIVSSFDATSAATIRSAIQARGVLPRLATEHGFAEKWEAARSHILEGKPMGGHHPPNATIGGRPAMLFEYRLLSPGQYEDAFWSPGKWQLLNDYPDDT